MKTIQKDLKSKNLSQNEAIEVTQESSTLETNSLGIVWDWIESQFSCAVIADVTAQQHCAWL